MKIKMNAVAAATAMILGTLSSAANANLVITEYIEGGKSFNAVDGKNNNNKAVEISNLGKTSVDLKKNKYVLSLYSNGATTARNKVTLSTSTGTLAPNASIVYFNSSAESAYQKVYSKLSFSYPSNVTYFNGDDALVLTKDGSEIDSFGQRGKDPGSGWKDPKNKDFSTVDRALRRKASVFKGDEGKEKAEDAFPGSVNQWVVVSADKPEDYAKGLGCPGEDACSDTPTTKPDTPDTKPDTTTGPCTNCVEVKPIEGLPAYKEENYYSDVINGTFSSTEELKNSLSSIIKKGHRQLTYKQVWTVLTKTDADPDPKKPDNVIELYTGKSISKYSNHSSSGSGKGKWNREHVWAKSHGFPEEKQLGYTDVHHLRPSDYGINTKKSNNDFGDCRKPKATIEEVKFDGRVVGYLDKANDCFEPVKEIKGDIARMMFYMDTRYQGAESSMPDLQLIDRTTTKEERTANKPIHGTLCTLYKWHKDDPVSAAEKRRNNIIYTYQGNRNPYIDDGDLNQNLVEQVYGSCEVTFNVANANAKVNETGTVTLNAAETKSKSGKPLTYTWTQKAGPKVEFEDKGAELSFTAPKVKIDSTLTFNLKVTDGTLMADKDFSVQVNNVPLTMNVSFTGNTDLKEGDSTSITATVADAPKGVSYRWKQVSGATAKFTATGLKLDVTSPEVNIDQALVFELTATVGEDRFSKPVSIKVKNTEEAGWTKPDGAGSFGGFMALLLPLMWWRRRQA